MNKFLERVEHVVDKAVPYSLIVLIAVVVIDLFYKEIAEHYHQELVLIDAAIVTLFVVDLVFKYNRVRNIPKFLKMYWLDVLAVLPVVLIFRFVEEAVLVSEQAVNAIKNLFHIGVVVEEEAPKIARTAEELIKAAEIERAAKISETERVVTTISREERLVREAEFVAKESRLARFERFIRPIRRLPRLFKAVSFYEHPSVKKTEYHKKSKI
jgi:hypothetical protein